MAPRRRRAPDVLAVVNGMGETGGAQDVECDYMQFTGSERTGKIVMKRAAEDAHHGQPGASAARTR